MWDEAAWKTAMCDVLMAHANEPPPPIHQLAPDLPLALSSTIARCLEKDPALRPPSAQAIVDALSTPVTGEVPYPADAATGSVATYEIPAPKVVPWKPIAIGIGALVAVALLAAVLAGDSDGESASAVAMPPTPSVPETSATTNNPFSTVDREVVAAGAAMRFS